MKHTNSSSAVRIVTLVAMILAATSCSPRPKLGPEQTETQTVELDDADSVRVEIDFGAGELEVSGGSEKLLEADFTYNVAKLKPEVTYTDGTLVVRQPEIKGLPVLRDTAGFRNEWALSLNDEVPIDLSVDMGAGTSDLKLAGLSLTGLEVNLGAGKSTIDLSGDWASDLDVTIDAGAGDISLQLPSDVGVRVNVDAGLGSVEAPGLTQDGDAYTNAAYGVSAVTLQVDMKAGVGKINLEVAQVSSSQPEPAATPDYSAVTGELSKQIQAIMEEAGITGLSVALVDDQEVVWSEGFGYADKEKGVEAAPETVYMLGSISKLFTASAIMQLAEQGKLDIDQPVQTYIPEFSVKSRFPDADPITARSLMTHHSGMPSDWINGEFAFGDDQDELTRSEFSNLVSEIEQAYVTNPPNTKFSYSNLGYGILGHVVEKAAGQEFNDYLDEALLQPLGMELP